MRYIALLILAVGIFSGFGCTAQQFDDLGNLKLDITITQTEIKLDVVKLKAIAGDRTVHLTWKNPDMDGFSLVHVVKNNLRSPAHEYDGSIIYVGTGEECIDTACLNGIQYNYAVYAWNDEYGYGEGTRIHATPFDDTPPASITRFDSTEGIDEITLDWDAGIEADWAGVYIIRNNSAQPVDRTDGDVVYTGSSETCTDPGFSEGTFWYGIYSYDDDGLYSDGVFLYVDTTPAPLGRFEATGGANQISLEWDAGTEADWAGVLIIRKENSYPDHKLDGVLIYRGTAESWVDLTTAEGTIYYYAAYSFDDDDLYSTGVFTSETPFDTTPPEPVTDFSAVADMEKIYLSWSNSTSPDFLRVRVVRKEGESPSDLSDGTVVYSGWSESFEESGLTAGIHYYYAIYAFDYHENQSVPLFADAIIEPDAYPSLTFTGYTDPGGGVLLFSFILKDLQSDECSIDVEFTDPYGYHSATMGLGGDGDLNLNSSPDGVVHVYAWDYSSDLSDTSIYTELRVTPSDGTHTGDPVVTSHFCLDDLFLVFSEIVMPYNTGLCTASIDDSDKIRALVTGNFLEKEIGGEWVKTPFNYSGAFLDATPDLNHLLTFQNPSYSNFLYYHTNTSGSWVQETICEVGLDVWASIAVDKNGFIHFVFYDTGLKYGTNTSGDWVITEVDMGDKVGYTPKLLLNSQGNPRVVYVDAENDMLKFAKKKSGVWTVETLVDMFVNIRLDAVIDNADKLHVAYRRSGNNCLKYISNKTGSWVDETVNDNSGTGKSPNIELDSSGKVFITSCAGNNGRLICTTNKTGSWKTIEVDSVGNVGEGSQLMIDSTDKKHVLYIEIGYDGCGFIYRIKYVSFD